MILTALIWSYITIIVFITGFGTAKLLHRLVGLQWRSVSIGWMLGLCFVTVYAEYFSLFCKVGAAANAVLLLLAIASALFLKKELWAAIKDFYQVYWKGQRHKAVLIILDAIIVLLFLGIACLRATHADTDLYHAQAIRWIEEYGVVKGLGNLHNRLAYNSAFMCLQALFSGAFLLQQSTHVVNAYIACGVFLYSFNTLFFFRKSDRFQSSDLFKSVTLIYICGPYSLSALSSPNTDTFALLMVLFILIKWSELTAGKVKEAAAYGVLCLLGVFACSLKLSAAMILLLVLKPAICLIKERKWKSIMVFLACGLVILGPFLSRNVIISGYLLYPYSALDLFSVDWKMAKSVVDFDNREIMAYGKGLGSYFLSNYSLTEWLPVWWKTQAAWVQIMVGLNVLMIAGYCLTLVYRIFRFSFHKIDWDEVLLFLTTAVAFLFWFFTAPLARYGMVFTFGVPCVILGKWAGKAHGRIYLYFAMSLAAVCFFLPANRIWSKMEYISLKRPSYYIFRECREIEWEGITMYVAEEHNYSGYYYLPAAAYEKTLQYIELRGSGVQDGFRVKEDVKGIRFNNSGMIY